MLQKIPDTESSSMLLVLESLEGTDDRNIHAIPELTSTRKW
jgi:hypothetical protein